MTQMHCPGVFDIDMSMMADIYSHLDAVTKAETGAAMIKRWGEKGIAKRVTAKVTLFANNQFIKDISFNLL